jgi:hypothetical protein
MAFVMLLLIAAPLFLFVGFIVKQKIIQHQMLEQLENASLQTITVNQTAVTWVKKNKELIVDGKMFDVKSYIITGDKIILTGLFDEEENKLNKKVTILIHQKKDNSVPLNQLILKFILTAVINKDAAPLITQAKQNSKPVYPTYKEAAVLQYSFVSTPPPNIFLFYPLF